jgi:RHS repeat-associated protein
LALDNNGVPASGGANPRWVGKGRTVFNNKGKPVKQYEPFFSSTHLYEAEPETTDTGVTPILFYDPVERVVATLHPNHTYDKVVFDPWRQEAWDVNDTVTQSDPTADPDVGEFFKRLPIVDYLPTWYDQRRNGQQGPDEKAAADKAAAHAATPTLAYFDTLGRPMLTVADNGRDANSAAQKYVSRVAMDIEGNEREVRDAVVQAGDPQGRIVMRYDYDMLGNRIHQSSMEAGQRWMLNDVTGKPIRSWDSRDHSSRTEYDELRRPLRSFVTGADTKSPVLEIRFEELIYGESAGTGLNAPQVLQANLRGRPYRHYDTAGIVTSDAYDFKGNLLRSTRQLAQDYKSTPDWSKNPQPAEVFASSTRCDALNRPVQMIAPHGNQPNTKINVIRPGYNEANLLERLDVWLAQTAEPSGLLDPQTANLHAVTNIDYNAKGQRTRIEYGNGALTEYAYDENTFRLIHLKTSRGGAAQVSAVFQDLFYTYDPVGNITHIRDGAQQTIFFDGQVVTPTSDYLYDAIYRLIAAGGREHIGQASQPETSWDDGPRTNQPMPTDRQAMRLYSEEYGYDEVGNFIDLVHHLGTLPSPEQSFGPVLWKRTYTYDKQSLTEPTKKSNRLSSTTVGATTQTYTYDAHGNMTMPHLTLMQWDFKDQLSATSRQAVNPTPPLDKVSETTFYVYDAGGQRVRKVTERQNSMRKEERIYLGGFEIYREFDGNGNGITLQRETLHIMDDKQRVALVETKTQGRDGSLPQLIRYQVGNHLGSASLELDDKAKAKVISYEEYYPYGSTSYQSVDQSVKAATKRYRYTGKERDEATGFTYHGARYYAAWVGRWVSCDPAGITADLNLFSYCNNSPGKLSDPNGKEPFDPQAGNPLVKWLLYGKDIFGEGYSKDTTIRDAITNDRNLEKAQYAAAAVSIVAVTVATGGAAGGVAAALGASPAGVAATSAVVGGAVFRGEVALAKGATLKEAGARAADPEAIADSLILAGAPEPPPGSLGARTGPPKATNTLAAKGTGVASAPAKPATPPPKPAAPTPGAAGETAMAPKLAPAPEASVSVSPAPESPAAAPPTTPIAATSEPHGNSLDSSKLHQVYQINDTQNPGVPNKYGISGQKGNVNGSSPRANRQVNELNRANPVPQGQPARYSAEIVAEVPNRRAAVATEQHLVNIQNNTLGNPGTGNQLPTPNQMYGPLAR